MKCMKIFGELYSSRLLCPSKEKKKNILKEQEIQWLRYEWKCARIQGRQTTSSCHLNIAASPTNIHCKKLLQ